VGVDTGAVPRPSPQTDRVVATINLLADTESGLTLSEIGRALSVDVSSCVHLLAALTASGYVVRDPDDRRYHLGPALVRPGAVARRLHRGPDRA
jgi:DNA-binding IclR family transcriptional regulator